MKFSMINVFIPHRWNTTDYDEISKLLERTKFEVRDYSVPKERSLTKIDRRYNVDPQIQSKIKWASVIVCSNRPALSGGMAIEEIEYAISIGKPIVAVKVTDNNNSDLIRYGIPIIAKRKDALESWICSNLR